MHTLTHTHSHILTHSQIHRVSRKSEFKTSKLKQQTSCRFEFNTGSSSFAPAIAVVVASVTNRPCDIFDMPFALQICVTHHYRCPPVQLTDKRRKSQSCFLLSVVSPRLTNWLAVFRQQKLEFESNRAFFVDLQTNSRMFPSNCH